MKNNLAILIVGSLFIFAIPSLHAMDDSDGYADNAGSEDDYDALMSEVRALDAEVREAIELSFRGKFQEAALIFAKYSPAEQSQWPTFCQKIAIEALEKSINKMRFVKENRHFTKKIVGKKVLSRVGSQYAVHQVKKNGQPFKDTTNKSNASDE